MNGKTEQIASNFISIASKLAPNQTIKKVVPNELKNIHVVWNGETVEELATGEKVSLHERNKKLSKINQFYKEFLEGKITKTQIHIVKDTNYQEMLIIDGNHRAIGFYKAYLENKDIQTKIKFTYKFYESNRIHKMFDYKRLFYPQGKSR